MELEEQVRRYKEIMRQVEALQKERKAIGAAILQQMRGKMLLVADFMIRKVQRFSFAVSIEEARKHNATKMEETIDKDKIKSLYQAGKAIEGVSEFSYVQVSKNQNLGR